VYTTYAMKPALLTSVNCLL